MDPVDTEAADNGQHHRHEGKPSRHTLDETADNKRNSKQNKKETR